MQLNYVLFLTFVLMIFCRRSKCFGVVMPVTHVQETCKTKMVDDQDAIESHSHSMLILHLYET